MGLGLTAGEQLPKKPVPLRLGRRCREVYYTNDRPKACFQQHECRIRSSEEITMKRILLPVIALIIVFGIPAPAPAGPREDVAAATQAWIDAMNSHDPERVYALYDSEAVLWGTRSPALRDNPAAVRDYFNILRTVDPSYKVIPGEQRIRVYGDIAVNSGTYTFSEVRDGKPTTRPARFSFVYRNRGGRWLIVDHHSSAVPSP